MTANCMTRIFRLAAVATTATIALLIVAGGAQGATAPVKEVIAAHFGAEVDTVTKGSVCTVASQHECQPGRDSSVAGGGFEANGVAVNETTGDVYVADTGNHRVQQLTATGAFVSMFGREVNTNGGDVCTAAEIAQCKAGVEGAAPGQFVYPNSIAVDPASGDVWVAEEVYVDGKFGQRVQKFTPEGQFLLEIGKEVNSTTKGNLCTHEETCGPPALSGGLMPSEAGGAFNFEQGDGNLLAVGSAGVLYVGDEHRVQEFEASGKYKGEISLTSISAEPENDVVALAVDQAGDTYLVYDVLCKGGATCRIEGGEGVHHQTAIREFSPSGTQIKELDTAHNVYNLAIDSAGNLAVIQEHNGALQDGLYEVGTAGLRLITEFPVPRRVGSLTFNATKLYVTGTEPGSEVIAYSPLPVGELVTGSAPCVPGVEHESDVTLTCTPQGEVDPWGVKETLVSFQWGTTPALGDQTKPPSPVASSKSEGEEEPLAQVSAPLEGLRPNETFYYRLVGEDQNIKAPELLTSEATSIRTPVVAPEVVGTPSVSFVSSSSAVMFDELNPENANTTYEFQYAQACAGAGENCPDIAQAPDLAETGAQESAVYGAIATATQATRLQPATTYRYRLLASDEREIAGKRVGGETAGVEGMFTTARAPAPSAVTGAPSVVGASTAAVSGAVNPDGAAATYAFELGVYNGSATKYGIVFSGPAGAGTIPVEETLPLTGLQPGTTYAYRITVKSGYGTQTGSPVLFTTAGLPAVLEVPSTLPFLAVPSIAFPTQTTGSTTTKKATPKCKQGKKLSHGRCVKAKAKPKKAKKSRAHKTSKQR